MSDPVVGAAWQTSAPIVTAAIAVSFGLERLTLLKIVGMCLALSGALFMLFFDQNFSKGSSVFVGNVLFVINIIGYSTYCLLTRPLLTDYGFIFLTAVTFTIVTGLLILATFVTDANASAYDMICPGGCSGWTLTRTEGAVLLYFALVFSVGQYSCINWANKYINASTIMSYTVLQPLTSAIFSFILVEVGYDQAHPNVHLERPSWNALGAFGIVAGLMLVVCEDDSKKTRGKATQPYEEISFAAPEERCLTP
eukprot:gene28814-35786_t